MKPNLKSAFSFVEVIISVVILSFVGMALLNFNSFNKTAMFNNINLQDTLLISTPFMFHEGDVDRSKNYKLSDMVSFKNLSDDDNRFLKSITLKAKKQIDEKLFLYNDGKKDYFIEYGTMYTYYKDYRPLKTLYIQREK